MNSYCVLKYQSKGTLNLGSVIHKTLGMEIKLQNGVRSCNGWFLTFAT